MRCEWFTNRQQDTETTLFQQYQENQDSLLLLHIKKSAKPLEQSSIKSLSLFLFLLKLIYHIDRITKFPLKKLLTQSVKNKKSGLSIFLFFIFYFYFIFDLFSFILFLELGLGLEWQDHAVTQQVTSEDMVTSYMTHRRVWKVLEG